MLLENLLGKNCSQLKRLIHHQPGDLFQQKHHSVFEATVVAGENQS